MAPLLQLLLVILAVICGLLIICASWVLIEAVGRGRDVCVPPESSCSSTGGGSGEQLEVGQPSPEGAAAALAETRHPASSSDSSQAQRFVTCGTSHPSSQDSAEDRMPARCSQEMVVLGTMAHTQTLRGLRQVLQGTRRERRRRRAVSTNPNRYSHFGWCGNLLETITAGPASADLAFDSEGMAHYTPFFLVAGACPSRFAPMQAMMVCWSRQLPEFNFWWLKPHPLDKSSLDPEMLIKRSSGPLANAAKHFTVVKMYQELVDFFRNRRVIPGGFVCGFDRRLCRAFVEEPLQADRPRFRLLLYLVWQEALGILPFNTYTEGRILYQKQLLGAETAGAAEEGLARSGPGPGPGPGPVLPGFFSRQFYLKNSLRLATSEFEEGFSSLLPRDQLQGLSEECRQVLRAS